MAPSGGQASTLPSEFHQLIRLDANSSALLTRNPERGRTRQQVGDQGKRAHLDECYYFRFV